MLKTRKRKEEEERQHTMKFPFLLFSNLRDANDFFRAYFPYTFGIWGIYTRVSLFQAIRIFENK